MKQRQEASILKMGAIVIVLIFRHLYKKKNVTYIGSLHCSSSLLSRPFFLEYQVELYIKLAIIMASPLVKVPARFSGFFSISNISFYYVSMFLLAVKKSNFQVSEIKRYDNYVAYFEILKGNQNTRVFPIDLEL